MRVHRTHAYLDLWRDADVLRRVVHAQTLVAARCEPMIRLTGGAAVVDLTFVRDGDIAVVPFVHIDGAMLAEPERSAFVWPWSAGNALSDDCAEGVEERVLPWLLSRFLAGRICEEAIRTFDDAAASETFERARSLGFLGAAPYEAAMVAAAPYVYAARFAQGASVYARDTSVAGAGVVMLARHARSIVADLGCEADNAFARRWFGSPIFSDAMSSEIFDVAIGAADALPPATTRIAIGESGEGVAVTVARPVVSDVTLSFDAEDSQEAGRFWVSTPSVHPRPVAVAAAPAAIGGSSGRILFALRDDGVRADDADTDAALELARRLRAEGFTVDVCAAASARPEGYDLLHAFTLGSIRELSTLLDRAETGGVPVVATPHLDDVTREGVWGAGITVGVHRVALDRERDVHLSAIARRRLRADGLDPRGAEPFAGYTETLRGNLARCAALVVESGAEERFVREVLGYRGHVAIVAPTLDAHRQADDVAAFAGDGDFVFAHAPIEARSNLLLLVHAAMRSELPLILAGPVLDAEFLALLREIGNERIVTLTAASGAQIAGLYRRARVFADVSWSDRGCARMARAAICGAAAVISSAAYGAEVLRPGPWPVDRASVDAIAAGLTSAWQACGEDRITAGARRAAAWCDPVMALRGVAETYARALPVPHSG